MINEKDKNHKRMVERYGEDTANYLRMQTEKEKQVETAELKRKFEAKKNVDNVMRQRYGDEMADIFVKIEKEKKARYSSEIGDTIKDIVTEDRVDKAYTEIYEEYSRKLNRLFNLLEVEINLHRKDLVSIDPDMEKIALLIIWQTIKTKYPEYLKDK